MPPAFVEYKTEAEYREHFLNYYCRACIRTFDGVRVYFRQTRFEHAFYQSSHGKAGAKDLFSLERAQRIDWIRAALESPQAELYFGWDKKNKVIEYGRRVAVVYGDYVVVVDLFRADGEITHANFVTAYVADASIGKIKGGPRWDKQLFLGGGTGR